MPVPVPCVSKPPAHPVVKPRLSDSIKTSSFRNLTRTLPGSPTGPPPSFGTREEWINSLPSWRRSKPRRIWEEESYDRSATSHYHHQVPRQGFHQGLAVADNAAVIKGLRAEACLPPLAPSAQEHITVPQEDVDMYSPHYNSPSYLESDDMELQVDLLTSGAEANDEIYGGTPFFEDESPNGSDGHDYGSSPLEPVTPFGDYVDQAVAGGGYLPPHEWHHEDKLYTQSVALHPIQEGITDPAPAAPQVAPTATAGYRKLSEPLSEWIANFVWKACTTGSNLIACPPIRVTKVYSESPPPYLATSVHSLLLSTLLQPSAIFLALWYIMKLPVFFGAVSLHADDVKELNFRLSLLGERHSLDRDAVESNAPFRLIVLGCMLANKWLDDHTFSNKTWHTISNLPVQGLNQLESLALALFNYDLNISSEDWSQWLSHLMSYHSLRSSPSHLQPISRPSSSPSAIIRLAIDEIIQAPKAQHFDSKNPQPVFIGLEERKRARVQKDQANSPIEYEFDDDGPLREEYIPKRRVANAITVRHVYPTDENQGSWETAQNGGKGLPPPARWSPAADEPILRDSNRMYGRYVAVQPSRTNNFMPYPPYQRVQDMYHTQWPIIASAYSAAEVQPRIGYSYEMPTLQHPPQPPVYNHRPALLVPAPFSLSHSRSQSLSHDQDISHPHNRLRSYSQSHPAGRQSETIRSTQELPPHPTHADACWGSTYAYHHHALFAPLPPNYTWLGA